MYKQTNTIMNECVIIRMTKEMSDAYFNMCEQEGFTLSKRVRKFIELDLKLNVSGINSIKELEKIINENV